MEPGGRVRVLIGNLSYDVDEERLREELKKYGEILGVSIPTGRDGRSKGLGIVDFATKEIATEVRTALDREVFLGRKCYVQFDGEERTSSRPRRDDRRDRRDRDRDYGRRRRRDDDYSDDYDRRRGRRDSGRERRRDDYRDRRRRDDSPPSRRRRYRSSDESS